jgi:hypothetical protein
MAFLRKGCVFHQIVGAADIWSEVYNVQRVVDKKCFNLTKHPNDSSSPPRNETLLIYGPSRESSVYGHVAAIYVLKDGLYYIIVKDFHIKIIQI